jgi:hypothetical protein
MSKKKEASKKKRDLEKYPALNPRLNAKTRYEVLDMDYLKKLNKSELEYLNQFMAEYVSGAFKKDENGNYSEENMHKTVEERRECYTRNNTRNRCGLTVSNATGLTVRANNIGDIIESMTDPDLFADSVNKMSDIIFDEYDGDYSAMEEKINQEMYEDYKKCINPETEMDRKMSESNYGKMLLLKFNNVNLNKK